MIMLLSFTTLCFIPVKDISTTAIMIYIVMGVSGSGKTRIGKKLAQKLSLPFHDADNFHPQFNINKMKSGMPLTDSDRKPWLEKLANNVNKWKEEGGAVLACSALKKSYRQLLKSKEDSAVQFIYLKGTPEFIEKRMRRREGHFMPPGLLNSQFEALEEPQDAIVVSITQKPAKIVNEILKKISV